MTDQAPLRVLLVDDQELVRSGFRLILESAGVVVVGEAGDGAEAVRLAADLEPDVVLMDIRMPGVDGIEATRILRREGGPRVVILTTFGLDEYVFEALRAGASGFLLKDVTRQRLVEAVEVVAAGEALLSPSVTRTLIERFAGAPGPTPDERALRPLTARERETLGLLAKGLTNAEMAAAMYVGEATVKTHVGNVLMKLGLRDRVQAVIFAYEHGVA
jgi:DNA-binding NarL/FixJ family response regulator